jgi:FlaA1/EpsC-like NDP-sugar epimerase
MTSPESASANTASARLFEWLRQRHSVSVILADAVLCALGSLTTFYIRFEFSIPPQWLAILWQIIAFWVVAKIVFFYLFEVHRFAWRFTSTLELERIVLANLAGSVVGSVAIVIWLKGRFSWSLPLLEYLLALAFTAGARLSFRLVYEHYNAQSVHQQRLIRAVIYGAGSTGMSLLREIRNNRDLRYEVLGFIDDDPSKQGAYIHGLRVMATGAELKQLAVHYSIEHALVTIPSATGAQMSAIYHTCMDSGLVCRTIPGIGEVVEGRALANQIRDISIEDLLGRQPISLDQQSIMSVVAGQVVIVTGAAGSIGSEMCRQIARFQPAAIIGYEVAETPLFFLNQEMINRYPHVVFHAEIGSIQDGNRLAEVIRKYRPKILFHAAAYKHVPMMEANPYEAVANNVFGTECVLRTALAEHVDTFVMISTDKAVRPTNVMGTTKRLAELVVRALSGETMKCVSVRFGNVLGSNGSVIPIFKQQIAAGGPITVTHPDMRRYFMTIPEASQLVLQASAIGKSGEIMVLDMGELVRIVDLAHNLIRLAGLQPNVDIKIKFSGIRPGEKLYEELNLDDESILPTNHSKIKVFKGAVWERAVMEEHLQKIRVAWTERNTEKLLRLMKEAVPEYSMDAHLLSSQQTAMPETSAGDEHDDRAAVVHLLSGTGGQFNARILESSDQFLTLAMESPLTIGAAVSVDRPTAIYLGEVCVGAAVDGEGVAVTVKLKHCLPKTVPDRSRKPTEQPSPTR